MREHVCCEHVVASIWVPHALARSDLLRTVPTIFVFEFRMDLGIGWTLNASGCISGRAQSINKYLIYILGWRLMVAKVAGYVAIASVPPRHDAISARDATISASRLPSSTSSAPPTRYSPPSGRFTSQPYPRPAEELPGRARGRSRKMGRRPRWWPCRTGSVSSRAASSPTRNSTPRSTARKRAYHARGYTAIARMIRARQR